MQFGFTRRLSLTSATGIAAHLPSNSGSKLAWPGCWCVTTTKAIPLSGGVFLKNSSSASSPPAEAPRPTMGKALAGAIGGAAGAPAQDEGWGSPAARLVFVVALLSPPVPAGLLRRACFRALFRLGIIVVGEWCVECGPGSSTNNPAQSNRAHDKTGLADGRIRLDPLKQAPGVS
jgi:hypothetical protein